MIQFILIALVTAGVIFLLLQDPYKREDRGNGSGSDGWWPGNDSDGGDGGD